MLQTWWSPSFDVAVYYALKPVQISPLCIKNAILPVSLGQSPLPLMVVSLLHSEGRWIAFVTSVTFSLRWDWVCLLRYGSCLINYWGTPAFDIVQVSDVCPGHDVYDVMSPPLPSLCR